MKTRKSPVNTVIGASIVALLIGTWLLSWEPRQTPDGFNRMCDEYLAEGKKFKDVWFELPNPAEAKAYINHIQEILDRYDVDLPDHKKSAAAIFAKSTKGVLLEMLPDGSERHSVVVPGYDTLINLVPASLPKVAQMNKGPFCANDDGTRMLLSAIQVPDLFMAGCLIHELGHVELGLQGRRENSHEYQMKEEATMHRRCMEVVNTALHGAYKKALLEILKRRSVGNVQEAIMLLTKADFSKLDDIIGCQGGGFHLRALTVIEHCCSIGILYQESVGKPIGDAYETVINFEEKAHGKK